MELILQGGPRHLAPEQLYREATAIGMRMSLATVYNALNLFAQQGLLRRVDVGDRTLFCSNQEDHHHLYDEGSGELSDVPAHLLCLSGSAPLPEGAELIRTDIIVRYRRRKG